SAPLVLADRMRELFPSRALTPTPRVVATLAAEPPKDAKGTETNTERARRSVAQTVRSRGLWAVALVLLIGAAAIGSAKWMHARASSAEPQRHAMQAASVAQPTETPPRAPEPVPSAPEKVELRKSVPGRLSITAPLTCDVTIDGRSRGRTPL